MAMESLKLLLIQTFYFKNLQLFNIVEDGDKYNYYLSLLQLIEMQINNILNVTITIFIGFTMRTLIFLNVKEGEGGDGEKRAQSQQQAQSPTTALAGATISDKKDWKGNKKLHFGAFDTFSMLYLVQLILLF